MTADRDECRPPPDRAVCAVRPCTYAEVSDDFPKAARRELVGELQGERYGLSAEDAGTAVNHVSDRVLRLSSLGKVVVTGFNACDRCGGRKPQFAESPGLTDHAYQRACCPYHPDGRAWSGQPGDNVVPE